MYMWMNPKCFKRTSTALPFDLHIKRVRPYVRVNDTSLYV